MAFGFIFLVIYLAGLYFTNRARAKVNQMRGPRRFQPDWNHGTTRRRRRKPTRGGGFSPQWSSGRRSREEASETDAPAAEDEKTPS